MRKMLTVCTLTSCAMQSGNPIETITEGAQSTEEPPPVSSTVSVPAADLCDFTVEVAVGRDPIVLQITDTQIIDPAQMRTADRLSAQSIAYWSLDQREARCYGYLREMFQEIKPDLIVLTGDLVYGEFDDAGTSFLDFIEFMESFGIPWAPVFGNHDNESAKSIDWQCEQLEKAEHCLFKQRTITGNGNYTVGITQGGVLKRVFFMLDSNGCAPAKNDNGHTKTTAGFGADQISWYETTAKQILEESPSTKLSFAFHIQLSVFADAYQKYGFTNSGTAENPINIDFHKDKADSDFGYLGRDLKSAWDSDRSVWKSIKALGADSILVGHEHCNSASVVYEGVRLQFGQKSSEYDRYNNVKADGTIVGSYMPSGITLIGGTVLPLSEADGSIKDPYIYLCKEAGGSIDWDQWIEDDSIVVSGLQKGTDLTTSDALVLTAVAFDENGNAYRISGTGQGKIYISTELLKGKTTFTFSIYHPEDSTAKLGGKGEFSIRIKPDSAEPNIDGTVNGYIDYNSNSSNAALKVAFGEWQTFTVDITGLADACTELSLVIPAGNVVYIKDLSIT